MDITDKNFKVILGKMRESETSDVAYHCNNGSYCGQASISMQIDDYRKRLRDRNENMGMLMAMEYFLAGAKDECSSKKALQNLVANELNTNRSFMKQYAANMRTLKYRRWMVGSANSLISQMFAHRSGSGPKYPVFATCRDAWYRLSDDVTVYSVLAAASARLDAGSNEAEYNELLDFSVGTFRANVALFRKPESDKVVDYRIHGRAIVSFGLTDGCVPIMLSLDCTFDMDGKIDGLDRKLGYDIVAFRPFEEKTVTRMPRRTRVEEITKGG
jgi:hypothetical protein